MFASSSGGLASLLQVVPTGVFDPFAILFLIGAGFALWLVWAVLRAPAITLRPESDPDEAEEAASGPPPSTRGPRDR